MLQVSSSSKDSSSNSEYAGPYRLMETLGKGGLATVKVGLEFSSGTRVAVKIIDKEKLANPREQVSMAREITIMKLLKHKNILRLYDIYENEEKIFLILDLFEGGDLYGHLTQRGAMRPQEALVLFRQIIAGVEYCHKCMIVHRDLKPENLLLSADKKQLVISDFGLSTGMQGSRNLLKTRCGTVHYISPEVAKGDPYVGMASDVWSVGIILYAMVTATLPFDAPTSVAVLKKIVRGEYHMPAHLPPDLQALIRLMLTLDPKERITIPQIKQHQWYLGLKEETPRQLSAREPDPLYNIALDEIKENADIISNLKLLGWEESELMNDLLDQNTMNMAKAFYKLLVENKNLPVDKKDDSPKVIDKKVLRRRSVAAPARTAQVGVTADPTIIKIHNDIKSKGKRSSQRAVRLSERPIRKEKRDSSDYQEPPVQPITITPAPEAKLDQSGTGAPKTSINVTKSGVVWGISPTLEPEAKKYSVESNKSVTQILESLKNCFSEIGQYDISTKQTKNGIKVKARRSGKRHGSPVVKLHVITQKEGDPTEIIIKGGGGKSNKEEFKELAKKVEETLVV